ncbi:hypothetical protein D3C81_2162450 [compost metagenome]
MCQFADLSASTDADARIRLASAHFFHRIRQSAQILQDECIQHVSNSSDQKNKPYIDPDN